MCAHWNHPGTPKDTEAWWLSWDSELFLQVQPRLGFQTLPDDSIVWPRSKTSVCRISSLLHPLTPVRGRNSAICAHQPRHWPISLQDQMHPSGDQPPPSLPRPHWKAPINVCSGVGVARRTGGRAKKSQLPGPGLVSSLLGNIRNLSPLRLLSWKKKLIYRFFLPLPFLISSHILQRILRCFLFFMSKLCSFHHLKKCPPHSSHKQPTVPEKVTFWLIDCFLQVGLGLQNQGSLYSLVVKRNVFFTSSNKHLPKAQ